MIERRGPFRAQCVAHAPSTYAFAADRVPTPRRARCAAMPTRTAAGAVRVRTLDSRADPLVELALFEQQVTPEDG